MEGREGGGEGGGRVENCTVCMSKHACLQLGVFTQMLTHLCVDVQNLMYHLDKYMTVSFNKNDKSISSVS